MVKFLLKDKFLLKNSGLVFGFRLLGMVLAYLMMIAITNLLGAKIYGRYTISVTLLQLLVLICSLGIPTAVVKLTSDKENFNFFPRNDYLKKAFIIVVISALVVSFIGLFLNTFLAETIFDDIKLVKYFNFISYTLVFTVLHSFVLEFLRGRLKFKHFAFGLYVLPYIIFFSFFYFFKSLSFDEEYYFLGYVLGISLTGIFFLRFFPFKKLKTNIQYPANKLFKLSIPMLITSAFVFFINWTDVFMLGALVTKEEVGIYNVAYKLATIVLIVIHAVNTIVAPKIASLFSQNKLYEIEELINKSTKMITVITLPVVVVLILFRKHVLSLFGLDFIAGESVLIVVSLGLLFNALSGSVSQVLNMTKHQKELKNITIVCAVLNILLNLFLIPKFGILGAAYASLISNVFFNLFGIYLVKKYLGFYTFIKI
ncbi:flippase [Pontimicrobium sp. IMCC45349]|uniref:flippase n=1 Tax=Pontimicrobium sp. IMCC45349 TaxID=3391574 RepID=UPI0039A15583